jgi:hypothetical protein
MIFRFGSAEMIWFDAPLCPFDRMQAIDCTADELRNTSCFSGDISNNLMTVRDSESLAMIVGCTSAKAKMSDIQHASLRLGFVKKVIRNQLQDSESTMRASTETAATACVRQCRGAGERGARLYLPTPASTYKRFNNFLKHKTCLNLPPH